MSWTAISASPLTINSRSRATGNGLALGLHLVSDAKFLRDTDEMQAALPSGRIRDGLRIQHCALESLHRTDVGLRCALFDRNAEASRARFTADPSTTLPCWMRPLIRDGVTMTTSNASPLSTCLASRLDAPHVNFSLCPVSLSSCGMSSTTAAFTPLEARIVISAAQAVIFAPGKRTAQQPPPHK